MKKNYYSLHGDAIDKNGVKHVVTVVGELICGHQKKDIKWDTEVVLDPDRDKKVMGELSFSKNVLHRKLTVGSAICCPVDEFNEEVGIKIAKSRIRKGDDCGILETNSVTMLTPDQVMAILLNKLKWICDHIDMYISDADLTPEETDATTAEEDTDVEDENETEFDLDMDEELNDDVPYYGPLHDLLQTLTNYKKSCENVTCCQKKQSRQDEDIDDFIFGY